MKPSLQLQILIVPLFSILVALGLTLSSCQPIHGSIINEIPPLNGNLHDQGSPIAMCEDENYFYLLMNMPYRATKKLAFPANYNPGKTKTDANPQTPEYEPLPSDDARMIPTWESLDKFESSYNFSASSLSCRAIINFKGTIYASFCDDSLRYQSSNTFDNYNFIFKLNNEGVWIDSNLSAPLISSPNLTETDPSKINEETHRLFGYLEDLSAYEQNLNDLSEDERNAYEVAQKFYTNQIRKTEVSTFYVIEDELYILVSDIHIRDYNLSSPIKFASNSLMRLYRVDNIESAPTLTLVTYNKGLEPSIYKSQKELLTLIKEQMALYNQNYFVARSKIVLQQLYRESSSGETEWIKVYKKEENLWKSTSYTQVAHLYLQDSLPSFLSKAFVQNSPNGILFFSKDGLFELKKSPTLTLNNITQILPYGIQIDTQSSNEPTLIDAATSIPTTKDEEEELKKRFYTRYLINDFYTYKHPVSGLQHTLVITAMQNHIDGTLRYDIWSYTGDILSATCNSWAYQTISGSTLIKNDKNSSRKSRILTPTSFVFYTNDISPRPDNYPIDSTRTIHQLLLGTNKGFYTADPDPSSTDTETPFASTSSSNGDKPNYAYEKNISTITISSSHISGFYPTTAIVDEVEVPVLFVFTAGNGLWLNYNRYFNIE